VTTVLIQNAAYVVTVDDEDRIHENATIEIHDGVITSIRPARDPGGGWAPQQPEGGPGDSAGDRASEADGRSPMRPRPQAEPEGMARPMDGPGGSEGERQRALADGRRPRHPSGAAVRGGTTVIDARRKLVMPGLVNLHTHLPMTLLRGIAEHVDLAGFLDRVWSAEKAVMDPPTVELGARLGALESLRAGCTTQLDMYIHPEAAHRGAVAVGARHVGGPVFFDFPGPDGMDWPDRMALLERWPAVLAGTGGPEVPAAAMPHGTYTVGPEHLRDVAEVVHRWPGRRLLTTHVSETTSENEDVRSRHGASPTGVLERAGWFGGNRPVPVVLGHGVHLDEADRMRVAAAFAAVAHCPGSNLKLASGALDWQDWHDSGLRVGLGTDGCSSSNDLDMWQAMRQAALLARLTSGSPEAAPAEQVLRAATVEGARALGLGDLVGSVEVGKRADLVLLDLDAPHLTPVHDVPALLVFAAGRGDVSDVLVDGEVVVRDRRSARVDEHDLLSRCRRRAALARAPGTPGRLAAAGEG
jgi:5-methylthioadenosine/S-adenosylhomocysteine deaminase